MAKNAGKLEKGLTMAIDMVSPISLRDIWSMVGDLIDDRHLEKFPSVIDGKRYRAEKAEHDRALDLFEKSLSPEQKKLYCDFESAQTRKEYWREVAGFYLGFATALRFGPGGATRSKRRGL